MLRNVQLIVPLLVICVSCQPTLVVDDYTGNEAGIPEDVLLEIKRGNYPKEVDFPIVPDGHPSLVCMRKKAHQLAYIEWRPMGTVPGLIQPVPVGEIYKGIPYSSVKEKDKFVGMEVSFHTFMSAVNNPRSVFYTDNVSSPPYNGTNCGPYYGTVCSIAVNYALGIDRPYESSMYETIPYIAKVKEQSPSGVRPGDILWSKGHVVLVLDVHHVNKQILGFSILESSGCTSIKELSLEAFSERWKTVGWVLYRDLKLAENVDYSSIPYVFNPGDVAVIPEFNNDICTSRGDRVSYVEGESVTINVFNKQYDRIELYRNGILFSSILNDKADYVWDSLITGSYEAKLARDGSFSRSVFFEVINERTSVIKNGDSYDVFMGSENGIPLYWVVCSKNGARKLIKDISSSEKEAGELSIDGSYSGLFLKVFYQGEYGRVSNKPILLN